MFAQDIMTRDVATVSLDTPLPAAIKLLLDKRVSGMPVLDAAQRLVGIITEGDLLRRTETGTEASHSRLVNFLKGPRGLAAEYVRSHSRLVSDLMTPRVVSVSPKMPLEEVVRTMERNRIKRVPVTDPDSGKLLGIVARSDLLRVLADAMVKPPSPRVSESDLAIRRTLVDELRSKSWSQALNVKVEVNDGEVSLEGIVYDEPTRAALRVAAQNTPGVKGVRDELSLIDPSTTMIVGV